MLMNIRVHERSWRMTYKAEYLAVRTALYLARDRCVPYKMTSWRWSAISCMSYTVQEVVGIYLHPQSESGGEQIRSRWTHGETADHRQAVCVAGTCDLSSEE